MKLHYTPIVLDNIKVSGITANTVLSGQQAKVYVKQFLSSQEERFRLTINNLLSLFPFEHNPHKSLNSLLIIIKPDYKAYVYKHFPFAVETKVARDLKAGEAVFREDIADILSISFKDASIDLNPEKGDQVVWLFRENWHFGLYFDFTRRQGRDFLLQDMAYYYKKIMYLDLFEFLSQQNNFNALVLDGWFPFVRLVGGQFDNLITYYSEDKQFDVHIEKILNYFDKDRITSLTTLWWRNPVLNAKKDIIQAGIEAYLANSAAGDINCIKNLISELEGIIRMAYYNETGKAEMKTSEIKKYIVDCGKKEFTALSSLGFTDEFLLYLNNFVFTGFDIANGVIPASRHSYAHGVATSVNYSHVRALQLILTIDQISFYLGSKTV